MVPNRSQIESHLPSNRRALSASGRRRRLHHQWIPYVLVAPAIVTILGLVVYPLLFSVVDSFRVDNLLYPGIHQFIGFRNYRAVLADPAFRQSAVNTLIYFALGSVSVLAGGLVISLWLQQYHGWKRGLLLVTIILPWAVPGVVTGLLWSFIYNPSSGLLDALLRDFHLIQQNIVWFNRTWVSLVLIALALVWQILPLASIVFLAGLESIPHTIYEAAIVDGAHPVTTFFRITLPLLRPSIAIVMVQTAVYGIGIFDQVYVLTGYSPATKSVVIQTYLYAFQNLNFGQGISAALIITMAIAVIGFIYLKGIYREVSY